MSGNTGRARCGAPLPAICAAAGGAQGCRGSDSPPEKGQRIGTEQGGAGRQLVLDRSMFRWARLGRSRTAPPCAEDVGVAVLLAQEGLMDDGFIK